MLKLLSFMWVSEQNWRPEKTSNVICKLPKGLSYQAIRNNLWNMRIGLNCNGNTFRIIMIINISLSFSLVFLYFEHKSVIK